MADEKNDKAPAEEEEKENEAAKVVAPDDGHLPNTKRYLPKACTRKIVIPFVMPWEASAAKQTQRGMGAFGGARKNLAKVDLGEKGLKQGALNTENILSCFADTGASKYATQSGMSGFGATRKQVTTFISSKELSKERTQAGEGIIPKQSGSTDLPSQSGETPMGSIRSQTTKVHYKEDMSNRMDPESDTFVHRLIQPNPNNHAGSGVMDTRRKHVLNIQHHDRFTENILPRLRDVSMLADCKGTGAGIHGLGAFRGTVTKVKDGYGMTYDEELASKLSKTWATGGILQTQEGTGGFSKHRDVVSKVSHAIQDQQVPRKRYVY